MPLAALTLVLLSAASHASWNLAVKGSRQKYAFGGGFCWWRFSAWVVTRWCWPGEVLSSECCVLSGRSLLSTQY
jgi:hypothetical protein